MKIIPIIGAVYKSKDGNWRGFCYPYDVSCTADSDKEAWKKLDGLVETYEEALNQYNNPVHLILNKITDEEDQKLFKKIWPEISKKIAKDIENASTPQKYSESLSAAKYVNLDSGRQSSVLYSHRSASPLVS